MKYLRPRSGDLATVGGREFPCSYLRSERTVRLFSASEGVPDEGFREWLPAVKRWYKPVPVDECDRMVSVQLVARYHDVPVVVAKQWPTASGFSGPPDRGEISVLRVGGRPDLERRGFVRIDKAEWVARARIADLTQVVEEHRDLLFKERRVTDPPALRRGMYAVRDGKEHPARRASTIDDVELIDPDGSATLSPLDDLQRLHEVSVHVRHADTNGGPTSEVLKIDADGIASLRAVRAGDLLIKRLGYHEHQGGWFTETPLTELDVWVEMHHDLLFPRWAPRGSGNGWPAADGPS